MEIIALEGVIAIKFSNGRGFPSILMDYNVLFFKVMYDPFSYKMGRDVFGDDWKFGGVSDGMNDAMSNGSGDGGGENGMKAEDISVLVSEFVF